MQMGAGLEPGIIIYSRALAAQLGIADEHAQRQQLAITYQDASVEGFNGTRVATAAVSAELTRRGWS